VYRGVARPVQTHHPKISWSLAPRLRGQSYLVLRRQRMKPTTNVLAAAVAFIALGGTAYAEMPKAIGDSEGEVDIVAWPGYIERGESDKAYDWVTAFEKETGCKVNVKTAATSDEMVTLMNQGGFDLVTASGDASLRLVAGKKVQPVNVDLIPSWK